MNTEVHRGYLEQLRSLVANLEILEAKADRQIQEIRHQADQRIEKIQSELAGQKRELEQYRHLIGQVAILAGESPGGTSSTLEASLRKLGGPSDSIEIDGDENSPVPHADIAEIVLRKAHRPMKINEIIEEMEEMEHPLPRDHQSRFNTVYKALQRRGHVFENCGKEGWALSPASTDESSKGQLGSGGMTTAEKAEVALKQIGHPATAAQIHGELLGLGYTIHPIPKKATQLIYKAIQQSPLFEPIFGGRWELAGGFPKTVRK